MSSILKKDRKPAQMLIITESEEVARNVLKIVNDDNKIPKRQRFTIGGRLIDHAMNSYEDLRAANAVYPNSNKKMSNRLRLGQAAETEINKLNSDLRVLPAVVNVIDKETGNECKWYKELTDSTIKLEKHINHWNRGEMSRANKVREESLKSINKENKENSTTEIKPAPVTKVISIDEVTNNDYIGGKIRDNHIAG